MQRKMRRHAEDQCRQRRAPLTKQDDETTAAHGWVGITVATMCDPQQVIGHVVAALSRPQLARQPAAVRTGTVGQLPPPTPADGCWPVELTLEQFFAQISELRAAHVGDGSKQSAAGSAGRLGPTAPASWRKPRESPVSLKTVTDARGAA